MYNLNSPYPLFFLSMLLYISFALTTATLSPKELAHHEMKVSLAGWQEKRNYIQVATQTCLFSFCYTGEILEDLWEQNSRHG